jgi:large subunit ribosomal protein L21
MKYAVIRLQGHQYKVSEGDLIKVDKLDGEPQPEVMLLVSNGKVEVGNPLVKNVKVALSVLGETRGEKIDVVKYKAKARYRKHIGFRSELTSLRVDKIS